MSRILTLLAVVSFCTFVGCAGDVYECTCYCVRQVPVDEIDQSLNICAVDGFNPQEVACTQSDCPAGYNLSGADCNTTGENCKVTSITGFEEL